MIAEICAGSYEDAKIAFEAGADRIELNQALELGGLTPSFGSLKKTLELGIPVTVMIRNRPGGFCYSEAVYQSMKEDLLLFCETAIEGAAFGFLTDGYKIDEKRTKEFTDILHDHGKNAVFHRAFDNTRSPNAIDRLVDLGVDRVLTSGRAKTAIQGVGNFAEFKNKNITVVAGSGLNPQNLDEFHRAVTLTQYHSSASGFGFDPTAELNADFNTAGDGKFRKTNKKTAKAFVDAVHRLQP